jgi:regulator of protease activity HflC (stomatin/prohibitin superfamily)
MLTLMFLALAAIVIALSGIRVAQEYQRSVVFRLGRLNGVRGPGLYYLIPFVERGVVVDIRTRTETIEQQETITKDSVTIKVNAVMWYEILDPAKAIVAVADYRYAAYQVALTSLRNIIGQHALDDVLRERNSINERLRDIVDGVTEPWGIRIRLIEMKDVEIPVAMQRAMAREAEAIREKRARVIKAEAELEASVQLADASRNMSGNPISLELRRLQTISEVGAENNTTTIMLIPSEFTDAARALAQR